MLRSKTKRSSIWLYPICDSKFPVVFLNRRAYTLIFSADCIQVTCPNWPLFLRTPVVHWCAAGARPYGHAHIKRLHDALLTKTANERCESSLWKPHSLGIQSVERFLKRWFKWRGTKRVYGSSSQSFPWCRSSGDNTEYYMYHIKCTVYDFVTWSTKIYRFILYVYLNCKI